MENFQNRFLKESVQSDHYFSCNSFLKGKFGERIGKITIDAGFTCPNRDGKKGYGGCIYCDALGSGIGKKIPLEQQIEEQLSYRIKKYKKFLLYFQAYTNTYDNVEDLNKRYEIINKYDELVGLVIGTRADCIDEEKLELINSYTDKYFVQIEYGLQSINKGTRDWMNRLETIEEFENALNMTYVYQNIFIGVHVIFGLPYETRNYHIELAEYINSLNIDGIKIHNLYIPKSSPLAKIYEKQGIKLIKQDEFVKQIYEFLKILNKNIVIMRIGGTALPNELLAPQWALNKFTTFEKLRKLYLK